jgi:hypothetical protein
MASRRLGIIPSHHLKLATPARASCPASLLARTNNSLPLSLSSVSVRYSSKLLPLIRMSTIATFKVPSVANEPNVSICGDFNCCSWLLRC